MAQLTLPAGEQELDFSGFMQSIIPIDHLEVVVNGKVVQTIAMNADRDAATFAGKLELPASGWVLLRAWNDDDSPYVFDRFPYATTNPVFVTIGGKPVRSAADADYFLHWIARVREATLSNTAYNTETERQAVLTDIDAATAVFKPAASPEFHSEFIHQAFKTLLVS